MADEKPRRAFEMELGEHGERLAFGSPEEFRKWLNDEHANWLWMEGACRPVSDIIWQHHRAFVSQLSDFDQNWRQTASRPEELDQVFVRLTALIKHYYVGRLILNSTSAAGRFILGLRKQHGEAVAAGAYTGLSSSPLRLSSDFNPEAMQGLIESFVFKRGIDWSGTAHQEVLVALKDKYEQEAVRQAAEAKSIAARNGSLNTAFEATLKEWQEALTNLHNSQVNSFDGLRAEHVEKLKAIEDTYNAKLALQKPVEYWETRQKYHQDRSNIFGVVSLVVAIACGGAMAIAIQKVFGAASSINPPQHWQLWVLVVAAFFSIWMTRIFVRIFLSHLHLATDAAERRTMILTYLAMSREGGQVTPEDKKLILQHIFRSASDGLVKDDAAPPSFLEFLSRK